MIITKTPLRISIIGGGTDIRAFYTNQVKGGAVIGLALNKYCYISLRRLPSFHKYKHRLVWSQIELINDIQEIKHPIIKELFSEILSDDEGLEIHHSADLPALSGLGSSSAFTVGLITALGALRGITLSSRELASMAIEIERVRLKEAGGEQDQFFAAFGGGLTRVDFTANGFNHHSIIMSTTKLSNLLDHLMLFFTGFQRQASVIEASKIRNLDSNTAALNDIRHSVDIAEHIMRKGNIEELGPLLNDTWEKKRTLAPDVSNGNIDSLYDSALRAGATGGKLLGAGGGGFMLLFVPPKQKDRVRESLRGLIEVPVGIATRGSEVVVYEPEAL